MTTSFSSFWLLLKVQLKMRLRFGNRAGQRANATLLVTALSFLILIGVYVFLLISIMPPMVAQGMGNLALAIVCLLSMLVVFMFGTLSVTTVLFGGRDAPFYLGLPVPPGAVFASKFAQVYLSELLLEAALVLPAAVIYGVLSSCGPLFYLAVLLVVLSLPLIPLVISTLLAMPLMRLVANTQRRELITFIFTVILVVGIMALNIGLQGFFQQGAEDFLDDPEALNELLTSGADDLSQIMIYFPPARWAANAMTQPDGWLDLLFLIAASAAGFILTLLMARPFYRRATLALLETPPRHGKQRRAAGAHGVTPALILREFRGLLRSAVYASNSLLMVVLMPLVLILLPVIGSSGFSGGDIQGLLNEYSHLGLPVAIAIVSFFSSFNVMAPATSFSREGSSFWVARTLPVSMRTHAMAKFWSGFLISTGGAVLSVAVLPILLPLPWWHLALAFLMVLPLCAGCVALSVALDLSHPKLIWNSETEAMKQNKNGVIAMFASMALVIAVNAAMFVLIFVLPDSLWGYLAFVALSCALAYLSFSLLHRSADKMERADP